MRKTFTYAIVLFFTNVIAFAQSKQIRMQPDVRLYNAFDKKFVEDIAANDSFWLLKSNFYLTNAAFFSEISNVKEQDVDNISLVHLKDTTNFNIYLFERDQKIKRDYYTYTIYKIAEYPQLYLVYYPTHDYIENFNRFLKLAQSN